MSYRTFDIRQRLPSGKHSLVQYRSLRKNAHLRDICPDTSCRKLRSHWLKVPCRLTLLASHMQGVSPIEECRWKRTRGVKSGINKSCMTIELVFAYDWPLHCHILFQFSRCPWWMKCSADPCMVRALSKTKTGKMSALQILSNRRKYLKIPQGARRDENRRNNTKFWKH